jgi:hypothetical protein
MPGDECPESLSLPSRLSAELPLGAARSGNMARVHGTRTALVLVLAAIVGVGSGALAFRLHQPQHHQRRVTVTPQNLGSMLEGCAPLVACPKGPYVSTAFDGVDNRYLVTPTERFLLPGHAVAIDCYLHHEHRLQDLPRRQFIEVFVDAATAVVRRVECVYRA